jgi:hypothetical protein
MSLLRNALNAIIPVREDRIFSVGAAMASLNAETVFAVNGDQSMIFQVLGNSPSMTLAWEGSIDGGFTYFAIPAVPINAVGGTIPNMAQIALTEALTAAVTVRAYALRTAGLSTVRVRVSAYTSGSVTVSARSSPVESIHPALFLPPVPLAVTNTAAASSAVTLTLPAVTGLRHLISHIEITRSATAALTAAAAPVVVTTTNLPGALAFTFGSDAGGIGLDKTIQKDFMGGGLAASAVNTATTIVAPAYTGVIWRITAAYTLGL